MACTAESFAYSKVRLDLSCLSRGHVAFFRHEEQLVSSAWCLVDRFEVRLRSVKEERTRKGAVCTITRSGHLVLWERRADRLVSWLSCYHLNGVAIVDPPGTIRCGSGGMATWTQEQPTVGLREVASNLGVRPCEHVLRFLRIRGSESLGTGRSTGILQKEGR